MFNQTSVILWKHFLFLFTKFTNFQRLDLSICQMPFWNVIRFPAITLKATSSGQNVTLHLRVIFTHTPAVSLLTSKWRIEVVAAFFFSIVYFWVKKNGVRKRKRGFIIFPEELGAKKLLCFVTLNYAWIITEFFNEFKSHHHGILWQAKGMPALGSVPLWAFFFHFIFSKICSVRIKYWMSLCTNIYNKFFSGCIIIWKLCVRKFVMWHPCD